MICLLSFLLFAGTLEAAGPGFRPGLPVTGAFSMFPCGTEVLDHLCPHPVVVFAVCAAEPQQVGGVVGCQRRQSELRVERRTAPGLEGKGLLDQGLRRRGAQQDQGSWFDETELFSEHLDPLPDLTGPGRTVRCTSPTLFDRADLDYVGHVYLRAVDPGFFEQPVEQLPGVAHERAALLDLLLARRLSYDREAGVERTFAEDRVLAKSSGRPLFQLLPFRFPGHLVVTSLSAGRRGNSRRSVRRL